MIVFMTRYSILDETCTAFRNTNITDERRLDFKRKIFSTITLPSVVKQTDKNWKWIIYAGSWLKDKEFEKWLYEDADKRIVVRFVDSYKEFLELSDIDSIGNTTVRLDDDDALAPSFISKLRKYEDQLIYQIISFPNGRKFKGKERKDHVQKNIALGLSRINGNIYRCGNHSKIDQKFNVFYDESPRMYLLCCSDFCDTKRKF